MGIFFTDKFSLLHLATGIIAYYWSISFISWFALHFFYEIIENTNTGMFLINHITLWPGGKNKADTILNQIGDQFYALLGWLIAYTVSLYSI